MSQWNGSASSPRSWTQSSAPPWSVAPWNAATPFAKASAAQRGASWDPTQKDR